MRTTVRLDPQLMADARRFAFETGRTLTRLIEEALREKIARHAKPRARTAVTLPTYRGGGLQPGVDLDDSSRLRDRMDAG
ncbi:MAG: type II toxin-antitoxin system VapB family antitoxin [Gemmatimonadota bacterium]